MRKLLYSGAMAVTVTAVGLYVAHPDVAKVLTSGAAAQDAGLPKLQVIQDLSTPGPIVDIQWSSDGRMLAASSRSAAMSLPGQPLAAPFGNLITIWSAEGEVIQKLRRTQPFIETLDTFAFVAQDRQIAASSPVDSGSVAASIFDIATGEVVHEIPGLHPGRPRNVNRATVLVTSPNQSILAVAFGRALAQPAALYRTLNWSKLPDQPDVPWNQAEHPASFAFSPDGRFLALGRIDNVVIIYDMDSRKVVQWIKSFPDGGPLSKVAFSPDGSMIAAARAKLAQARWLPNGGREIIPPKDNVRVFKVSDGSQIAVYPPPFHPVEGLAWTADGRFLAFLTGSRRLHLWDPFRPEPNERTFELSREGGSSALAMSPDGTTLAVGVGHNVRTFRVTP